jgi:hypothetical protein
MPDWALEAVDTTWRGVKSGTPAALTFFLNRDRLDQSLLKSLRVEPSARPQGLDSTLDSPSGRFRVHYAIEGTHECFESDVDVDGNGHPDYIDVVAATMDTVHSYIVDTLGYPVPPDDGDGRYDVYIMNLSLAYYGVTFPEDTLTDPVDGLYRATSYLALRSDYSLLPGYQDNPLDGLRVTCAHEYFHAVHFALDPYETEVNDDGSIRPYAVELSSVWMEEEIYDEINDYYNYLPVFYANPAVSLQSFANAVDQHPYACGIWTIFLVQQFSRDAVREIWFRCRSYGMGASFLEAADDVIDSLSNGTENWATLFSEFALANYFTGDRADYLPVEISRQRFWRCESGSMPDCTDSVVVTDSLSSWDWITVDTGTFRGFEEADQYPSFPDSVLHLTYRYPAIATNFTNTYQPEHNGLYYQRLENTEIIPWDTTYWRCRAGVWPNCSDSQIVRDTTLGYDFLHTDSNWYFALGDQQRGASGDTAVPTLPNGWGVNIIRQLESNLDSFVVENRMAPDDIIWRWPFPDRYREETRSITVALSPGTPDYLYYSTQHYRGMDLGYRIGDALQLPTSAINRPAAVLKPFPNPVVVADLDERKVSFEFQVNTDTTGYPVYNEPHLVIDIFTIAGERVATIDDISGSGQQYAGVHYADWDLRNERGAEVASGVYIAYARLWSAEKKGILLAEDHKKVAVIR